MGGQFSTLGIAGQDESCDDSMLMPDHEALIGIVQDHAHGSLQMRPLGHHGFLDRGVTGQAVDRGMEIDIRLDERGGRTIRLQRSPMLQSFFKLTALRCSSGTRRDALGGKASGEGIQRCSDLIQVDDFASFQWSHGKAALAAFRQEALVLEKLKGVADWLSRNTKPFSQFLLSDPATGKQTAVRYGSTSRS